MKIGNLEVYGVIYKITNKVNGKVYIGQTSRINGFRDRYPYKGEGIERVKLYHEKTKNDKGYCNEYLLNSIYKYGCENFDVCEIFDFAFSREELNIKEELYIRLYKSMDKDYGYNFREGGDGGKHNKDSKNKQGRKVICLNDGKEFLSLQEASEYYGIPPKYIKKTMNKKVYSDIKNFKYLRFIEPKEDLKDNEKYCCCCGKIIKLRRIINERYSKTVKVYNRSQKYCKKCAEEMKKKRDRFRKSGTEDVPNKKCGIIKFYEYNKIK